MDPVSNYLTTFDENRVKMTLKENCLLLFKLQAISYDKLFEKSQIHWSIIIFLGCIICEKLFYKHYNSHNNSAVETLYSIPTL